MAYQKSGDKWMSGSTQIDADSVQTVIDKLRDLSATKLADKMAGTQDLHDCGHVRRQSSGRKGDHQ